MAAEIRLRNVSPILEKKLNVIAESKKFATHTKTIEFLIEQYEPTQSKIKQQEKTIRELEQKLAKFEANQEDFVGTIAAHVRSMEEQIKESNLLLKKLGGSKKTAKKQHSVSSYSFM